MKPEPLPDIFCPHGWRKFQQAQQNFLRRHHAKRSRKNILRILKWGREMNKWINRIYSDKLYEPVSVVFDELEPE